MPANVAPSASTASGTSITSGDSMHGMIAVAMIVVAVIVMRLGRQARRPVAALAEEGHEHEAPGIEGGQAGGDVGA